MTKALKSMVSKADPIRLASLLVPHRTTCRTASSKKKCMTGDGECKAYDEGWREEGIRQKMLSFWHGGLEISGFQANYKPTDVAIWL